MKPEEIKKLTKHNQHLRTEAEYYKNIAATAGAERLRDVAQLSGLISELNKTKAKLEQARNELEARVTERTEELLSSRQECLIHQEDLAHKNIELKSLLHILEEEKKVLEKKTTSTFRESLIPLFELLKESLLSESQQHIIESIEHILSNMSSSLTQSMKNNIHFFTPTELKVANFIRVGKTTKEISTILCSSNRTVEGHRLSIRKKFQLKPGQNLRVFLQNLS